MAFRLLLQLCLILFMVDAHGQKILIKNGEYFNAETKSIIRGDILVDGNKIITVNKRIKGDEDVIEINAEGKYIIPGLFDSHIHLFQSGGLYTRPDVVDLRKIRPYDEQQQWLEDHTEDILRRYLALGITSVIDVGGPMKNYQLRDALQGRKDLPTLFMTGPLISTYQPVEFIIKDAPILKVKSEEEARKLVRKQARNNPDFIKIWYITLPQQSAESTYDIVKAAIDESHKHNLRVAVHATELNTAKLAVHAGADFLVHSVDDEVDEDFIRLLKENDVIYVPTMIVHGKYIETFTQTYKPSASDFKYANPTTLGSIFDTRHLTENRDIKSYKSYADDLQRDLEKQATSRGKNLKTLQDAGIVIATGSDAGNIGTQHASSYQEELRLMSAAGLTNAEILSASTIGAAKAVNKADKMGHISANTIADLVILDENPLESLDALQAIHLVMNKGHLIDPDTLIEVTPAMLAQQQLNGYNAGNIDAFLAPYAEDVRIYNFPDQLIMEGKAAMRSQYSSMFKQYPNLHCKLVNRMVQGNTVIDQEEITGVDNGPWKAIAIYKIKNGKIQEVYFL